MARPKKFKDTEVNKILKEALNKAHGSGSYFDLPKDKRVSARIPMSAYKFLLENDMTVQQALDFILARLHKFT